MRNVFLIFLTTILMSPIRPNLLRADEEKPKTEEPKTEAGNEKPSDLDKITITASRREQKMFDSAYSVRILSMEEIATLKQARTLPETFLDEPSVMVQKTANGQGSPFIRGFTGFRTLLLIDGIRVNNSVFRDGPNQYWNTIDPYMIESLELVKGPNSVLYGSDAVGGTVDLHSRHRQSFEDGFHWNARTMTRLATVDRSWIERVEGSMNYNKNLGVFAGITFKNFGNVESGGDLGRQEHTGYDEQDGDLRVDYYFNDHHALTFGWNKVSQSDIWRTHATVYAQPWRMSDLGTDLERSYDQTRELAYLRYTGNDLADWLEKMLVTASLHQQDEDFHRIRGNRRFEDSPVEIDTMGFSLQMESDSLIGYLTYGAEYYHDVVETKFTSYNPNQTLRQIGIQGQVGDDSEYDLLGIYLQDEITLAERWDLTLGARFTDVSLESDKVMDPQTGNQISLSEDWDQFTGSTRLLYNATEEIHLFASIAQGFRAPNLSDLTRLDIARTGELETPSPNLDPEKFLSYEIGVKVDWRDLWTFQASMYRTDIDDMIVRYRTGTVIDAAFEVQKSNVGDGYVHGVEAYADYNLPWYNLQAFGSFGWMEGRLDNFVGANATKKTEPFDRMMPANGVLGLRWKDEEKKLLLEGFARMVSKQDRLNEANSLDASRIPPDGVPGYTTFTLRGVWTCNEHAEFSLAIENITDKRFRILGSGQNEPGRNVVLTFSFEF